MSWNLIQTGQTQALVEIPVMHQLSTLINVFAAQVSSERSFIIGWRLIISYHLDRLATERQVLRRTHCLAGRSESCSTCKNHPGTCCSLAQRYRRRGLSRHEQGDSQRSTGATGCSRWGALAASHSATLENILLDIFYLNVWRKTTIEVKFYIKIVKEVIHF